MRAIVRILAGSQFQYVSVNFPYIMTSLSIRWLWKASRSVIDTIVATSYSCFPQTKMTLTMMISAMREVEDGAI